MKYLQPLIQSLVQQVGVNLKILARDDGSTDETVQFLYSQACNVNLSLITGENIGVDRSFKFLMKEAMSYEFDFVAFCDQDDIWMPDKLIRAVEQLKINKKSHYSSKRLCFDIDVEKAITYPKKKVYIELKKSIFENFSSGCTVVVKKDLFYSLVKSRCTEITGSYDHIIFLMSLILDESYFDQESRIFYRLHENNTVGIKFGYYRSVRKTYKEINRRKNTIGEIVQYLQSSINQNDLQFMIELLRNRNFIQQVKWCYQLPKMRKTIFEDLVLKIMLIISFKEISISS